MWIADTINGAKTTGKRYTDHVVLVRAASQTRALEEAFVKKKVPYKILNGAQFYSSEEIKTVLAYLRMVYAMNDMDFVWTVQRPRRGFGKKSVEALKKYAGQKGITLMDALGEQISQGIITKQALVDYYQQMMALHAVCQKLSAKELTKQVLDMGYRAELEQDVDQTRLDNVAEFLSNIAALEEENQEPLPLDELLAHFALFSQQDDDTDEELVRIMTIHTAKGLEFDTVFVNGLVEGQFPSKRLRNQDELEEERRLFYVAITRAKSALYLSSYEEKATSFAARQSSFLSDIDGKLLDCINNSSIGIPGATPAMVAKARFDIGENVMHPGFGAGKIIHVDEVGQVYEIFFEKLNSTRQIMFRAHLEKL